MWYSRSDYSSPSSSRLSLLAPSPSPASPVPPQPYAPTLAETLIPTQALPMYRSMPSSTTPPLVKPHNRAMLRSVSVNVLRALAPCNFLVFGLGHDSLMWAAFNPRGITVFLEEDIKWVHKVLSRAPLLRVHAIHYDTRLSDADDLLASYKSVKECLPPKVTLRGNVFCRLALSELPDEIYRREWDVIMIDGPKGYFAAAPGRMSVIFSAAVIARGRTRPGVTHVFLHDVNRKVEKLFAEEFLCKKYLVKSVGRLWHFAIPSAKNEDGSSKNTFC